MSSARAGGAQSKQLRDRNRLLLEQLVQGQQTVRRDVLSTVAAGARVNVSGRARAVESSAAAADPRPPPQRRFAAEDQDAGRDDGNGASRRCNDENSPAKIHRRSRIGEAEKAPHLAGAERRCRLPPRGLESPPASPTDGGTRRRERGAAAVVGDDDCIRKKLADAFDEPRRPAAAAASPSTPPRPSTPTDAERPWLPAETPKSILKRRRLIDDNVPVASRLQHTPGWMERIGSGGGDARRSAAALASSSRCREASAGGSGFSTSAAAAARPRLRSVSFARAGGARDDGVASRRQQQQWRSPGGDDDGSEEEELTLDSGNYRPASVARAAETPRPTLKCGLGASRRHGSGRAERADDCATGGGSTVAATTDTGAVTTASPYRGRGRKLAGARCSAAAADATAGRHPMLGYDWIAALLDNEETPAAVAAAAQLPDDFFERLRDFRRQNKDECVSQDRAAVEAKAKTPVKSSPLLTPSKEMVDAQAGDLPSPDHTCIHNYTVNQRLFAKPTNADETGKSRCPVCWRLRKSPTAASPGFVRVSIPRATLMTPYKVRPHRRKSFDPSDSYALSKHCLAGWENQRAPPAVVARNVDLANETNRLKTKWTSTIKEAEELALKLKKLPLRSRDLDTTTLYTRQLRQIVDDLHKI